MALLEFGSERTSRNLLRGKQVHHVKPSSLRIGDSLELAPMSLQSRLLRVLGLLILCLFVVSGCAKKVPAGAAMNPERPKWERIAVMPVINKTAETQVASLIRAHAIEAVYNKGYKKLPAPVVDEQLAERYRAGAAPSAQVVGEALDVDAVLYCTLSEWKKSAMPAYASITVTATFELRSAKNGEVLWRDSKTIVRRSIHPLKKELLELMLMDYEASVVELVEAGMASLPNGPNFIAKDPLEKSKYEGWF